MIGDLSDEDVSKKISVQDINAELRLDRAEIKNILEYFEGLGFIEIASIADHYYMGTSGLKKQV